MASSPKKLKTNAQRLDRVHVIDLTQAGNEYDDPIIFNIKEERVDNEEEYTVTEWNENANATTIPEANETTIPEAEESPAQESDTPIPPPIELIDSNNNENQMTGKNQLDMISSGPEKSPVLVKQPDEKVPIDEMPSCSKSVEKPKPVPVEEKPTCSSAVKQAEKVKK